MTAPPKRRWFSFRLQTLFVLVTMAACALGWLVWQRHIIRERKVVLNELRVDGKKVVINWAEHFMELDAAGVSIPTYSHLQVSRLRRWLGDQSVFELQIPEGTNPELIYRTELTFPEARLQIGGIFRQITAWRDSLYTPTAERRQNIGTIFKTGLIEKSPSNIHKAE